jgi:hypothetical protein
MSQFSFAEGFFPQGPKLNDSFIFDKGIPIVGTSQTLFNDYMFWAQLNWYVNLLYLFQF